MVAPAPATGVPTAGTLGGIVPSDGSWIGYAAGDVLFSETMSIDRTPVSGGTYQNILDTGGVNIDSLWATSTRLYFSNPAGTNYLTVSGVTQSLTSSVARLIWSDDVDLYWTTASSNSLFACRVTNCAATTKTVFATNCIINGVRGEGSAVYWGTSSGCTALGTSTLDNLQFWKLAR